MTTTITKVQSRNQITLPREVRRAAGIHAGDSVLIKSTGPGTVEIKVLPRLTIAELVRRYPIEGPLDMKQLQRDVEDDMAADAIRELNNE